MSTANQIYQNKLSESHTTRNHSDHSDSPEELGRKRTADNIQCFKPSFVADGMKRSKYSEESDPSAFPLNSLPPEILCHIFKYLPLKDREAIRLACKSWMKCCTCPSITQNEILVFRPGCEREDIIEILQETNFLRLNLEFQISPLLHCPLTSTWETCGHKIHEIVFQNNCIPDNEILKNIIIHCVNLTSIKLCKRWASHKSLEMLNYLIENNIKRTHLHTFVTFFPYYKKKLSIAWNTVKKFFLIFPCLKNLSIQFYNNRVLGSIPEEAVPIKLVHQLESLTYSIRSDSCWLENPIIGTCLGTEEVDKI